MPFKRNGFRRRRPFRRTNKLSATMAKKVRKVVRKELSHTVEEKYQDTLLVSTSIGTASYVLGVNYPANGSGANNFIGDQFNVKEIDMRYSLYTPTGVGAETGSIVRIILFWWYNGSVPTVASVLQNATVAYIIAPYVNYTHQDDKFTIVYDKTHALYYEASSGSKAIHFRKRYKAGKKITWETGTTYRPQLYMLAVSDSTATPDPQFSTAIRLRFTDS